MTVTTSPSHSRLAHQSAPGSVALPRQYASVSPGPLLKTTAGSRSQAFKGRLCRPGVEPRGLYSSAQGTAAAAGRAPTLRSMTVEHLLSPSYVTSQMQWRWGPLPRLLEATLVLLSLPALLFPIYTHPDVPRGLVLGFCSCTAMSEQPDSHWSP